MFQRYIREYTYCNANLVSHQKTPKAASTVVFVAFASHAYPGGSFCADFLLYQRQKVPKLKVTNQKSKAEI